MFVSSRVGSHTLFPELHLSLIIFSSFDKLYSSRLFGQMEALEKQLTTSKRVIKALKQALEDAEAAKSEADGSSAEVAHIKAIMEDKVTEMQNEKTEVEKDLTAQIKKLEFKMCEAQRISKWVQSELLKAKKDKEEIERQGAIKANKLQFALTNGQQIANFIKSKLDKSEEDKKALISQVKTLEFKLAESKRVSKFIEQKLVHTDQVKIQTQAKVGELEKELRSLNMRLSLKNDLITSQEKKFHQQQADTEQMREEKLETQGQLAAVTRMNTFLQGALSQAEHYKLATPDAKYQVLRDEIATLQKDLTEAKQQSLSVQSNLQLANHEKHVTIARVAELESQVETLQNRIAAQVSSQQALQIQEQKEQIAELVRKLQESKENAEHRQAPAPVITSPDETLVDLEFRLTQAEVSNKTLRGQLAALRNDKAAADEKIRYLECAQLI